MFVYLGLLIHNFEESTGWIKVLENAEFQPFLNIQLKFIRMFHPRDQKIISIFDNSYEYSIDHHECINFNYQSKTITSITNVLQNFLSHALYVLQIIFTFFSSCIYQ